MKHLKTFENFKPIKINNAKPFKIKKNLDTNIRYLQKGIKSLRSRLGKQKSLKKRSQMNQDINKRVKKLSDVTFKQLKQAEYLKNNPIKESLEDQSETLLSILKSSDFKKEDILKFIGFNENEYEFKLDYNWKDGYYPTYSKEGFTILFKLRKLEKLMNIENDFFNYLFRILSDYSDYDYYVEEDELDYLGNYIGNEAIEKVKKLAKIFNYKLKIDSDGDIEEGEIYKMFTYLGLSSELDDYKTEISYAHERAIKKAAKELIKTLPFDISTTYEKTYNCELSFDYDTIIEYLEKNNLEVKTIKELLENLSESSDFNYDFEYEGKYDHLEYTDLQKEINNHLDKYVEYPDEIFPKLMQTDNLKAFKNNIKLACFNCEYDTRVDYERVNWNLFQFANYYKDGEIFKWFKSDQFEKIIKAIGSESEISNYEDFAFKDDANKFNL